MYRALLGLNLSKATTIRVDKENAICLLGYGGRQINRHHMLPDWFVKAAMPSSKSLTQGSYGSGYSRDLLLVHQKGLPAGMCNADWRPSADI